MRKLRGLLLVLLLLDLAALGLWRGNNSLQTEEFHHTVPGLPAALEGLRAVQLSDLHGKQFGEGNKNLIRAVAAAEPDLIFLTGDFADAESSAADLLPLIDGLLPLAPVYYVTGNHEWGSGQGATVTRALEQWGVVCLENEYVPYEKDGGRILVAGVHDPNGYADQKTPEALAAEIAAAEPGVPWLLLAHRNNLFEGGYCRLGAALTFSGHAHGGLWRLPFTDGLISTEKELFPRHTSGLYACADGCDPPRWAFVSRGLGNSPHWTFRLFNRPQVAVVVLHTG